MRWAVLAGATVAALVGWAAPARASGDNRCTPKWTLANRDLTGCDSRLVLGPGNDTRVNLFLLLRDRHRGAVQPPARRDAPLLPQFDWLTFRAAWEPPAPPDENYLTGEGSRCRGSDDATAAFAGAVRRARGLTEAERTALIVARNAFQPQCGDAQALLAPITGTAAKPWADYLRAAAAFYDGKFAGAGQAFAALTTAGDPWLSETARYMVARVDINRAQANAFDDWGEADFKKIDRAALGRARDGFDRYLATYPAGRYTASARGLMRRVWWLGGDTGRLAGAYAALLAQPASARTVDDFELVQEIDYKLRPDRLTAITDPLLLATFDLQMMRGAQLSAAELARQRPAFAREPALYGYLQAAHALYVRGKPAEVLRLIPDATRERGVGTVALSRQLLRGQALAALRDPNAGGFWRQLLPATATPMQRSPVELGLALHEERAGRLDALLAPGSALTTPVLRETLLFTVADAAMLRRSARAAGLPRHEREIALFQLLYKELSRGFYADFVRDVALVPAGASNDVDLWDGLIYVPIAPLGLFTAGDNLGDLGCPALRVTAATLAANPAQPRARLCVADFFQANNFDGGTFDAQPPADELGGTRSLFPGRPYQRMTVYRQLLGSPATPAEEKSYALYRMIRCYAPTGNNSCGGGDAPIAERRAWFKRLKAEFPRSRWSRQLDIYW